MTETAEGGLLRLDADAFDALRDRCAEEFHVDPGAIEKDYWATEVLRSVAVPLGVVTQLIFKGGTSLSKAYKLIERFSEDIDIIVVIPPETSGNARKNTLRNLAARVDHDLGLTSDREAEGSGYLNARYATPDRAPVDYLTSGVLLEMGTRGGPAPNESRVVRALMSETAERLDATSLAEYSDLSPFDVTVLAPERTLAEKLAFLHHRATTNDVVVLAQGARHLYDVAMMLRHDYICDRLSAEVMHELMKDVDARSEAAGWGYTPRPSSGFAASIAFDFSAPHTDAFRRGYESVATLVWGEFPDFDAAIGIVLDRADLL